MSAGTRCRRTANGCRPFPTLATSFQNRTWTISRKSTRIQKKGRPSWGRSANASFPILEHGRADLVSGGPYRLNDFIEIDSAPGHSPGHVFFKLESKGKRAAFIGDVWHHLLQVYYPDWNFPKNSDAAQARVSRRKVLDYCASSGALVFPGPCRVALCRARRSDAKGIPAELQAINRLKAVELRGIVD